ncbi:stress responsive A/B barrel domain-containing protein [Plectosphaerella cucumerina]|uniref:Stress responsive A/B barrel domain-containing protein n=1 Tax=Plectosphaerella cucumerina TaxID=40658 RepID=A0A8K0TQL1_9PEZI|nr:stress responsive A/B barrel domain-containing protein [Plectosphaerella cucumerina]
MSVNRITLFKINKEEDRAKLLDLYRGMQQKAVKDGKPYILGVKAGTSYDDPRNQGYTIAVQSTFASKEDMAYYDNECAAHAELKAFAKTVNQGAMMVYFTSEI